MDIKDSILGNKYLYLLVSLVAYFLVMSFLVDHGIEADVHALMFSFIILFSVYSISHRKVILIVALIVGLIAFAENWLMNFLGSNKSLSILNNITTITFLSIVTYAVISNLLSHKKVTVDTLLGAICGYVLIGFIWTMLYMLTATLNPNAFSDAMLYADGDQRTQHFAYYSFVTLTTLGYGDIVPLTSLARTLSWLEAVVGQVYLTIWIAQLVGLHIVYKPMEK